MYNSHRYVGNFVTGKPEGSGVFSWSPTNYYEGQFLQGQMTGEGQFWLADGGLYEAGFYYPDRENLSEKYEAVFDGSTLR